MAFVIEDSGEYIDRGGIRQADPPHVEINDSSVKFIHNNILFGAILRKIVPFADRPPQMEKVSNDREKYSD